MVYPPFKSEQSIGAVRLISKILSILYCLYRKNFTLNFSPQQQQKTPAIAETNATQRLPARAGTNAEAGDVFNSWDNCNIKTACSSREECKSR
jgi:hypothetical protein